MLKNSQNHRCSVLCSLPPPFCMVWSGFVWLSGSQCSLQRETVPLCKWYLPVLCSCNEMQVVTNLLSEYLAMFQFNLIAKALTTIAAAWLLMKTMSLTIIDTFKKEEEESRVFSCHLLNFPISFWHLFVEVALLVRGNCISWYRHSIFVFVSA